MARIGLRLIGAGAGFLAGCLVWLLLYLLFQGVMALFNQHSAHLRVPLVLVFAPILGIYVGFKIGPDIFDLICSVYRHSTPVFRLISLAPVFWAVVVLAYVLVFNPFSSEWQYIDNDDWLQVAKIVLFPTGLLWSGCAFFRLIFHKNNP